MVALDFGAGPGTASWGLAAALGVVRPGSAADAKATAAGVARRATFRLETTFVETSVPMLEAANELAKGHFKTNWSKSLVDLARGLRTRAGAARYDVVLASSALSEFASPESRAAATALLWACVKEGGLLIVMENGDWFGAQVVGEARAALLGHARGSPTWKQANDVVSELLGPKSDQPATHHKAVVLSPCTHQGVCPLYGLGEGVGLPGRRRDGLDQSVSISARGEVGGDDDGDDDEEEHEEEEEEEDEEDEDDADAETENAHKTKKPTRELPSAKLGARPWCHFRLRAERIITATGPNLSGKGGVHDTKFSYVAIQKQAVSPESAPPADPTSPEAFRVLRTPLRKSRRVLLDLCAPDHPLRIQVNARTDPDGYVEAKKASWGDVWRPSRS